jgi:hypothetical protein
MQNVKKCKCGMVINIDEEEEHNKEYHIEVKCIHCSNKFPKQTIEQHQSNCDEIQIECKFCTLLVSRKDLREHEYICGAKSEKCERCHKYVPIKDTNRHLSNNCDGEDGYLSKHIDMNRLEVVKNNKRKVSGNDKKVSDEITTNDKPRIANVEKVAAVKVDIARDKIHSHINKENYGQRHAVDKAREVHVVGDTLGVYSTNKDLDKSKQGLNSMLRNNVKNSNPLDIQKKDILSSANKDKYVDNTVMSNKHRIDINKFEPAIESKPKMHNIMDNNKINLINKTNNNKLEGKDSKLLNKHQSLLDKHTTDKHTTDKHTTDKHTTDKHTTDKHTTDKHTTDKHTTDKHTTDKHTTYKQTTDKHLFDKHSLNNKYKASVNSDLYKPIDKHISPDLSKKQITNHKIENPIKQISNNKNNKNIKYLRN